MHGSPFVALGLSAFLSAASVSASASHSPSQSAAGHGPKEPLFIVETAPEAPAALDWDLRGPPGDGGEFVLEFDLSPPPGGLGSSRHRQDPLWDAIGKVLAKGTQPRGFPFVAPPRQAFANPFALDADRPPAHAVDLTVGGPGKEVSIDDLLKEFDSLFHVPARHPHPHPHPLPAPGPLGDLAVVLDFDYNHDAGAVHVNGLPVPADSDGPHPLALFPPVLGGGGLGLQPVTIEIETTTTLNADGTRTIAIESRIVDIGGTPVGSDAVMAMKMDVDHAAQTVDKSRLPAAGLAAFRNEAAELRKMAQLAPATQTKTHIPGKEKVQETYHWFIALSLLSRIALSAVTGLLLGAFTLLLIKLINVWAGTHEHFAGYEKVKRSGSPGKAWSDFKTSETKPLMSA